jgi:hypothetical protein
MEHEADHGQGDHGLGNPGQFLVALGQAPPPAEPTECSLNHPAARLHGEAGAAAGVADDDQRQAEQGAGQQGGDAVVDAVGERGPEPGLERLHTVQQASKAVGVLDVGRVHDHAQQQALRVNRDVALAALQPFGRIPAARSPFFPWS